MAEKNRLVAAGKYDRVFAVELEAGDVTAFGETVESVVRIDDHQTVVHMTNGYSSHFGDGNSTMLIEKKG